MEIRFKKRKACKMKARETWHSVAYCKVNIFSEFNLFFPSDELRISRDPFFVDSFYE